MGNKYSNVKGSMASNKPTSSSRCPGCDRKIGGFLAILRKKRQC